MILLETIHGSHLYGLAHADSDLDTFKVVADNPTVKSRYARQSIQGNLDATTCDLSTFVLYASNGVPQYLEAMWSHQAIVDHLFDMRFAFRPNYHKTVDTYQRTIKNFWAKGEELKDSDPPKSYKTKRHAYRLIINLLDLREYGMFNPTLSPDQLITINDMLDDQIPPEEYLL